MYTLAVVIHVIVCFLMIGAILLQAGKGAEIGAAFGGSSQTVFGSRGPGTFLSKVTVAAAIIFMLTSLGLAVLSKERTFSSTVIDLNKKDTSGTRDTGQKQDAVLPQGDPTKSQTPAPTAPEQTPTKP
jgi:preprotein translocase subunit SecG